MGGCQELGGNEMLAKGYKLSVVRGVCSGDPMYTMLIIVKNTIDLKFAQRMDLKCPHLSLSHTHHTITM